jgi:hypothetical protein
MLRRHHVALPTFAAPSALALALAVTACGGADVPASSSNGDGGSGGSSSSNPDATSTGATPSGATTTSTSTGSPTSTSTGDPSTNSSSGSGDPSSSSQGSGGDGGSGVGGSGAGGDGAGGTGGGDVDPSTCAEAEAANTNLGCDFWPTVTSNPVWEIFDYAVVVTNSGTSPAQVTVERDGTEVDDATVAPGAAHTFYLPWVDALKGPEVDCFGAITTATTSAEAANAAYHVTSTTPIAVYQFSSIEYTSEAGGPPNKDWSECPGLTCGLECFSFTNDASLLLPVSALGTSYRVVGYPSWETANLGSFLSIVATEDDTTVEVDLGPLAAVPGGGGIPAIATNGTGTITLNAGDVAQLIASVPGDFSGTLVTSDRPIQVISGVGCTNVPEDASGCDHLEETVLPVGALGARYLVARPSGPGGLVADHVVRIVGQTNGTTLTYTGSPPLGAPASINAGQVVDLGLVEGDFTIQASQPLAIATFLLGATLVGGEMGDPSQSTPVAVGQFRRRYEIVAPIGWAETYLDLILPTGATATLDGAPIGGTRTALSPGFDIVRRLLPDSNGGSHLVEASAPAGLQVLGYGEYSSYQFPGGVRLAP